MKECPRCLFDESIATIGDAQCEYCDLHDQLEAQANPSDLMPLLDKVRNNKKYDCIMGISGGVDSSLLLYLAVKKWNLKPLVIHFDNHYNVPQATHNMSQLIKLLNVDAITYNVNKLEYDTLNDAFIQAGLPDADIPNDIAMTKLMYDTAYKYGIKYILNGHDFRTEGSTPKGWTYMDAKYIRSVYKWHTNKELTNYPLFTFKDQLFYALIGIKNIRPFHYIKEREALESEMKAFISWKDYGGKHCENVYTEFVGGHLLPTKFGIDKRIVYLSAKVRSEKLTKNEAKKIFEVAHHWDKQKLDIAIPKRKMERNEFERYDFKKYRLLMWVLAKMKVVPYTFYIKYCK
jgi:tRNA(Ile)-lysidine synthase TilS/MesJ